ncbi:MAG: carbohydrate kinase family protein, partial [Ktedonobacteraceae bacterium]
KVGNDLFGHAILDIVRGYGDVLAGGMLVMEGEQSSYSIIISPPGLDRIIFHHPGANDTFEAGDIVLEQVSDVRLFHFGYPPLMRGIYYDGGESFAALLQAIKASGVTTSLDMALPDPDSAAGHVDWAAWLVRVLPYVDIFLPSVDEILYMLGRTDKMRSQQLDGRLLSTVAEQLLNLGVAAVALKLGNHGLYLRTTPDELRLQGMGNGAPPDLQAWRGRELFTPCFQADVVGTTGAGDCTIAGFLGGVLQGLSPEETLTSAVAVGACSVEKADATSGVPTWSAVQARLQAGWQRHPVTLPLPGWCHDVQYGVWRVPEE